MDEWRVVGVWPLVTLAALVSAAVVLSLVLVFGPSRDTVIEVSLTSPTPAVEPTITYQASPYTFEDPSYGSLECYVIEAYADGVWRQFEITGCFLFR